MNGAAIGRAYVPGKGVGTVYADAPGTGSVTVLLASGERLFVRRDRVNWRKR